MAEFLNVYDSTDPRISVYRPLDIEDAIDYWEAGFDDSHIAVPNAKIIRRSRATHFLLDRSSKLGAEPYPFSVLWHARRIAQQTERPELRLGMADEDIVLSIDATNLERTVRQSLVGRMDKEFQRRHAQMRKEQGVFHFLLRSRSESDMSAYLMLKGVTNEVYGNIIPNVLGSAVMANVLMHEGEYNASLFDSVFVEFTTH